MTELQGLIKEFICRRTIDSIVLAAFLAITPHASLAQTNKILITGMELTNNTLKLTFLSTYTNTSTWEVFAHDAGGENPAFDGLVTVWQLAETNFVLTNNASESWIDTNIAAAVSRFYALGSAADDDLDGLNNGREVFIFKTDIHRADTDGDGMDDGFEAQYGLNPHRAAIQDTNGVVDLLLHTPLEESDGP